MIERFKRSVLARPFKTGFWFHLVAMAVMLWLSFSVARVLGSLIYHVMGEPSDTLFWVLVGLATAPIIAGVVVMVVVDHWAKKAAKTQPMDEDTLTRHYSAGSWLGRVVGSVAGLVGGIMLLVLITRFD